MQKNESKALQGIAIVMMLLYHIFYVRQGGEYYSLVNFDGVPLLKRFSEICYPVPLYIILSGYGLYLTRNDRTWKSLFKKIFMLFLHVWILCAVFVPLASFINPDNYPGSFGELLLNLFAIKTSYNAQWWFIMPYCILILSSKLIFIILDKLGSTLSVLLSIIIKIGYVYIIKKYGFDNVRDTIGWLGFQMLMVSGFILPFVLGAIAQRECLVEKFKQWFSNHFKNNQIKSLVLILLFIAIIVFRLIFHNQTLQVVVVFILFITFPTFPIREKSMKVLVFLGNHSMNIWLIHSWFCFYLFKDFIYGLKYPIFIFMATFALSLAVSFLVEFIYRNITKSKN